MKRGNVQQTWFVTHYKNAVQPFVTLVVSTFLRVHRPAEKRSTRAEHYRVTLNVSSQRARQCKHYQNLPKPVRGHAPGLWS